MMTVACKAAGLSFFALGLIARRATGQDTTYTTCASLRTAVETGSATALTLGGDFECTEAITIGSGGEITIEGADKTITIDTTFLADASDSDIASSLFIVEAGGELVLNDVTITATEDESDGIRGVYNKGTLTVNNCIFSKLNTNVGSSNTFVPRGAAIYTASGNAVEVTDSTFTSNFVTTRGGAICADGTDLLTVSGSVFTSNEAGLEDEEAVEEAGAGGDIFATRGVELTVTSSNFTKSTAYYGGAAIECCGATISNCQFTATESAMDTEHYGALLVGRPGEEPCPMELEITDSTFTRCTVDVVGFGAGGSMAIFDTTANVEDCHFESSQGTAVLFQSSATGTPYQLTISSSFFYSNSNPAQEFSLNDFGTALAIQNTGLADEEEPTEMGVFKNVFCYLNDPYECEFVYHDSIMVHEGEFKCQACDQDGERQDIDLDNDSLSGTDRDANSGSNSSDGIVIGLSLALGLTLVVIGALAAWKFRVRKNARRLMEDMGEGDL